MRNLKQVVKQILPLIPPATEDPEEDNWYELREELTRLTSSWFAAAEVQGPSWCALAAAFDEMIGEPKETWQFEVLRIFTGKGNKVQIVMEQHHG